MNQQLPSQVEIIPVTQLNVGDVVRFHGARFQVHTAYMYRDQLGQAFTDPVMVALATWLDGDVMPCYFGPGKDWNFQGNEAHRVRRELAPAARTQADVDAALLQGMLALQRLETLEERDYAGHQVNAWYALQTAGLELA